MYYTIVPAKTGTIIVTIEYAENGLDWARLYDHNCLGWRLDTDADLPDPPLPRIFAGMLPEPLVDTTPVLSPGWAQYLGGDTIFVQNGWRGRVVDFFDWVATNNGAHRLLEGHFGIDSRLINDFSHWATTHPELVYHPG
jgi:hypothetical protein